MKNNSNVSKFGSVFFKLCKMAKFSSEQIKEILAIHKTTLTIFAKKAPS